MNLSNLAILADLRPELRETVKMDDSEGYPASPLRRLSQSQYLKRVNLRLDFL